jgi:hypothetical protein
MMIVTAETVEQQEQWEWAFFIVNANSRQKLACCSNDEEMELEVILHDSPCYGRNRGSRREGWVPEHLTNRLELLGTIGTSLCASNTHGMTMLLRLQWSQSPLRSWLLRYFTAEKMICNSGKGH